MNNRDLERLFQSSEEKVPYAIQQMVDDTLARLPEHPQKKEKTKLKWNRKWIKLGMVCTIAVTMGVLLGGFKESPTFANWMDRMFVSPMEEQTEQTKHADRPQKDEMVKEEEKSVNLNTDNMKKSLPNGTSLFIDRFSLSPSVTEIWIGNKTNEKISGIWVNEFSVQNEQGVVVGDYHKYKGVNFFEYRNSDRDQTDVNDADVSADSMIETFIFGPFPDSDVYTFHLKRVSLRYENKKKLYIADPKKATTFHIGEDELIVRDIRPDYDGDPSTVFTVEYRSKDKVTSATVAKVGEKNVRNTNGFENYRFQKLADGRHVVILDIKIQGTIYDLNKPINLEFVDVDKEFATDWQETLKAK
ncbi:hypothetical protein IC620_05050 [Hazenella sp. IB182357]|uniref:DUF4179 domain-containing protein n=1 Tax=Polycladospora coralii TaxID=2771432 RepID=A0A926N683_9BACL|nr:hypothetical protein [Polycladospora coralii]MBD1371726.1 hypothetical protein [Polycladospora coralii]MBS7529193.1 hypothetical protein [Polycladospora coralii]